MMSKTLCMLALCLPLFVCSQENEKGIKWVQGLTWQQVQQKAKEENKYIFVDCYATWCKPCKEMDAKVYTDDSVAAYINNNFISVKLQMDATPNDNDDVKSWYKTAKNIGSQYRIIAYPSYVFFAPTGEVVSKAIGYKEAPAFTQAARDATDPSKQYFPLLKKYNDGKLDHAGTVSLLTLAQQIGDTADYRQILNSYYAYLHKQKKQQLYTKENIEFVASTLDRSNMVLFDMFHPNGREVNRVMGSDWYAKKLVDKIIKAEITQPFLQKAGDTEPDWNNLHKSIQKKYGREYAGWNVLTAKSDWYGSKQNTLKWAAAFNDKIEKYGSDTTDRGDEFRLNNMASLIFSGLGADTLQRQEAIAELKRTSLWMEGVVRRGATATGFRLEQWPLYIDTYANLLHITGRTAEAIKWEEFAISKIKEIGGQGKDYLNYCEDILAKMKNGEPTW